MVHDNIYDVTFATGETIKCYISEIYYINNNPDPKINLVRCDTYKGVQIAPTDIIDIDNVLKTARVTLPLFLVKTDNLIYNYFQNSNLSAWKVWYCLDNDTARFAWANDSVDEGSPASIVINIESGAEILTFYRKKDSDIDSYYAWESKNLNECYTLSDTPNAGDLPYIDDAELGWSPMENAIIESYTPAHEGTELPNGRGVIYRLIDEWNNDCPYDFKNIQLYLPIVGGGYDSDGEKTWVYTFCLYNNDIGTYEDGSLKIIEVSVDDTYIVFNNIFMTANFDAIKHRKIEFNVALGNYSLSNEEGFAPENGIYVNCVSAIIVNSNTFLYYCKVDGFIAQSSGIYYSTKKVLTES